jgi:hypothetical protein
MKKFLIRLPVMLVSGGLSYLLAQHFILISKPASPGAYKFAGTILVALNAVFMIFELFSKSATKALDDIALDDALTLKEKQQLLENVDRSRKALNTTQAMSIALKGLSGLCGALLIAGPLAPAHFPGTFDLGYFCLGLAVPLIFFVRISEADFRKNKANLLATIHERKARETELKNLRAAAEHDFGQDSMLQKSGRVLTNDSQGERPIR